MTVTNHRRIAVVLLAAALAIAGGCGGSDSPKQARDKAAQKKARKAQVSNDDRYAPAVYLAKGLPPIELKYDLSAKPAAGVPFEVELAITPRNGGERLEFDVKGMPGLDVLGGGAASFQGVVGMQTYIAKVQVQPQAAGIYYLTVDVHLTTKVVNDDVSYNIPIVADVAPPAPEAGAVEATPAGTPAAAAPAPATP